MPGPAAIDDLLDAARQAMEHRDWPGAYERLVAADAQIDLGPEDLELLAKAAWWTGHATGSIEARERAYARFLDRGDRSGAASAALTLRRQYATKNQGSIAQGWLARAEELLEEEPESTSTAYLEIARGTGQWRAGELERGLHHMERASDIAGRFDDPDLRAWALTYRGMILVDRGELEQGWALMEQACASAAGGELGAYTTGGVFCNVISVCRDLADYRRGSEWADVAKRWCERHSMTGFPGVCRVHRAEIMRLLGAWGEADEEVRRACEELKEFSPAQVASAYHELGEVRVRMGDLRAADEAFRHAHELGEDPQPGLALLLVAEGNVDAAAASIRRSLEEETWNQLTRARLLPVQASIAHASGDAALARAAADELTSIAKEYPTTAIRANAAYAEGLAHLSGGASAEAVKDLRRSCQLWKEVDAPYEAATTAVALAEAYAGEGDEAAATRELESAKTTFDRLGAIISADLADATLRAIRDRPAGRPAVRTFLFTDIVGSTALVQAIGDEDWHRLRHWHDDTLRRCFRRHGGEEVDHAGDGFFVAFRDPPAAIACAVEVQRELAEHRRSHGFAPQVRMGLHATDATETKDGYAGKGVHVAARIGALAGAGEILASVDTIGEAAGVTASDPTEVHLKGIAEPTLVASIDWQRTR